jgi:hypothetical protein
MPKKTINACCILVSAVILLICASCGRGLEIKGDKVYDPKSGVSYHFVPSCYQPKGYSEEVFAVFELNGVTVDYYTVEGADSSEWLYSELKELIYSGDVSDLPDLSQFGADKLFLCYNSDANFSFDEITDKELLGRISDRFVSGERVNPTYYDHETYRLLFESAKYPSLYYMILLIVTGDAMYMHDRLSGVYVEATDLFSERIDFFSYESGND